MIFCDFDVLFLHLEKLKFEAEYSKIMRCFKDIWISWSGFVKYILLKCGKHVCAKDVYFFHRRCICKGYH